MPPHGSLEYASMYLCDLDKHPGRHSLRTLQVGDLHHTTHRAQHRARAECEHNIWSKKLTDCSHNKGNHRDWNLASFFTVGNLICWEKVIEAPGKRCHKKHVSDDCNDAIVLIGPRAHYQQVWGITLIDMSRGLSLKFNLQMWPSEMCKYRVTAVCEHIQQYSMPNQMSGTCSWWWHCSVP